MSFSERPRARGSLRLAVTICLDRISAARSSRGAAEFSMRARVAQCYSYLWKLSGPDAFAFAIHLRSVARVKYSCNLPPYGANPVIGLSALVRALPGAA